MRTLLLLPLLVGAAIISLLALPGGSTARGVRVGDLAPSIEAPTWRNELGRAPALEDLRGRAVLVEFWATW